MEDLDRIVGSRVRLYRKMKRFTLAELAERIHKSKATLSKYENGDIPLDVRTLCELADALGIRVQQLLDGVQAVQAGSASGDSFFPQRRIFVYYYEGRKRRIVRSLLSIRHEGAGSTATLYYDLPDFDAPEDCRNLYFGNVEYFDTITNFSFESQSNRMERVTLCAANPFDRSGRVPGLLTGISRYSMLPVSIKILLSPEPLSEDDALRAALILSPDECRRIRASNLFAVEAPV